MKLLYYYIVLKLMGHPVETEFSDSIAPSFVCDCCCCCYFRRDTCFSLDIFTHMCTFLVFQRKVRLMRLEKTREQEMHQGTLDTVAADLFVVFRIGRRLVKWMAE
jgi:hypothetical protein